MLSFKFTEQQCCAEEYYQLHQHHAASMAESFIAQLRKIVLNFNFGICSEKCDPAPTPAQGNFWSPEENSLFQLY